MKSQFLFDSAFPNGGYSHSFGFESYIAWGELGSISNYDKWLESYMLDVFAESDGAIYCIAFALKHQRLSLLKLAKVAHASISAFENRKAQVEMARSTLNNTEFMHHQDVQWYKRIAFKREEFANPALAFALLSDDDSLEQYAYATLRTLTINATRAIPLAYKKANELMFRKQELAQRAAQKSRDIAKPIIEKGFFSLDMSDRIFATHHELDLAMCAHERIEFRLFMS